DPPVTPGVEGTYLRTYRRHRRRADNLAARVDRQRAQLGLSLLLAARRDSHPARDAERRLPRRSRPMARLAATRRGGGSRRPPDHVWGRRRAPTRRARARVAARLRDLAPGEDR